MADKKVSELDAIAGSATAADDLFLIVDSSGSVTKKITRAELNNAIEQDVLSTVDINGGTIDSTVIGGATPAAGDFTTLGVDNININGNTISSTDTNGNINITPNGSGAVAFTTNATFGDNDKAIFGDAVGGDLQIYHDGSNSKIQETGTGDLFIDSSSALTLRQYSTNSVTAKFVGGGASELYYSNSKKLETTATGADITGTVTADGLTVDGNVSINGTNAGQLTLDATGQYTQMLFEQNSVANSGGDLIYDHTGNQFQLRSLGAGSISFKTGTSAGNTLNRAVIANNGDVSLYADDGTTQALFFDASTQRLGLGTTSPSTNLEINGGANNNIVRIVSTDANANIEFADNTTTSGLQIGANGDNMKFGISGTEAMRLDASGNLGLGSSSPRNASGFVGITLDDISGSFVDFNDSGTRVMTISGNATGNDINTVTAIPLRFKTNNTERMRLDSSGNLLLGTTSTISSNTNGGLYVSNNGYTSLFNRESAAGDGNIMLFAKGGTTVGSVGTNSSRTYIGSGSGQSGIKFNTNAIVPVAGADGANSDNTYDLGVSSARFKDAYFSGTVNADALSINSYSDPTNNYITLRPSFAPSASGGVGFAAKDHDGANNDGLGIYGHDGISFTSAGSEKARVDSSGNWHFNTTSNDYAVDGTVLRATHENIMIRTDGHPLLLNRQGSSGQILEFRYANTTRGTVSVTASGTTYNTTSDLRLKQDIEPLEATDKLMAMNPVSYAWKADPDGPRSMGFIAQEMADVMPEAVSTGDDDDAMMSMDYGRITPILVSALQDAHRKIEELAAEIAELKAN